MKARLYKPKPDSRASVALSIVVHIGLIFLIGSITFHYQFDLFRPERVAPTERIQYVRVRPGVPSPAAQIGGGGATPKQKPRTVSAAPVLRAPSTIPSTLPPVPPP